MKKTVINRCDFGDEVVVYYKEKVYGVRYVNLDFHKEFFNSCGSLKEAKEECRKSQEWALSHGYNHDYMVDSKIYRKSITYKKDIPLSLKRISAQHVDILSTYKKKYGDNLQAIGLYYGVRKRKAHIVICVRKEGKNFLIFKPNTKKAEIILADNVDLKGGHINWVKGSRPPYLYDSVLGAFNKSNQKVFEENLPDFSLDDNPFEDDEPNFDFGL